MHTLTLRPPAPLDEAVNNIICLSTVDEPWPPAAPPLNHFPAMLFCSLTLITDGRVALLDLDAAARPQPLPPWIISGPRTRPVVSMNLAPLRCVSILFYPDAFALLTGAAPAALQDRNDAAHKWLDAAWHDWPAALGERSSDPQAQMEWITERLSFQWQTVRAQWDAALGAELRQAGKHTPRSERQRQRQYRTQVGVTPKQAQRIQRVHDALQQIRNALETGDKVGLAALAAELGYADQAHLAHEMRALVGLSPSQFGSRLSDTAEFWPYRL